MTNALEREGVPTPDNGRYWSAKTLREMSLDDVYRPLSLDEVRALVSENLLSAEVAAGPDPEWSYGIWFFNRRRTLRTRAKRPDGSYYWRQKVQEKPRPEWIAVPVPDIGVPRELVEAAREAIKGNQRPAAAGYRYWELAGVFFCGACGRRMSKARRTKGRGYPGHYYSCPSRTTQGQDACPQVRGFRAEPLEAEVWALVRGLLEDPEKLRRGLDAMIEAPGTRAATPATRWRCTPTGSSPRSARGTVTWNWPPRGLWAATSCAPNSRSWRKPRRRRSARSRPYAGAPSASRPSSATATRCSRPTRARSPNA